MYQLRFLLTRYARPFYRRLAVALALGMTIVAGASFTAYFEPVAIVVAVCMGAVAVLAATLGILVLNVVAAAGLQRSLDRFEAAYDAYRRANAIPDIFYEEADLAEAAERDGALGAG